MNKTFSAKRFRRLFYKHTFEHFKSYAMSVCVLFGALVLGGSFLVYMAGLPLDRGVQTGLFFSIMLLAGTIFTSTVFSDLGEQKKAIAWLTLPATHFEKFLVGWIYSFAVFVVLYTACFYLADLVVLNLKHFDGHPVQVFNVLENSNFRIYLVYAFLHGIAIYGAICFHRLNFVKTALAFLSSVAMLLLINKILLYFMVVNNVESAPPFGDLRFSENGRVYTISVGGINQGDFLVWLIVLLAFLFWGAAYYRLKEKQV